MGGGVGQRRYQGGRREGRGVGQGAGGGGRRREGRGVGQGGGGGALQRINMAKARAIVGIMTVEGM